MKSIIREVGSNEFPRVKVSVGRRPAQMDLADFVLSRFDSHEKKTLDEELEASVDALFEILEHDVVTAQNHWNGWIAPSVLAMSEEERRRRDELDRERARQEAFLKNAERCGD